VRFESLARWLSDDPQENIATITMPIHFLREAKSFTEWKFSSMDDLNELRRPLLDDLISLALPFVERYSTLAAVGAAVESTNPKDWTRIGLDADRRVNVMAAIQMVRGDRAGAMKTLDDALAERNAALPRRRFEIEYLRRRLAQLH
jgi:hypothetical protein